MYLLLRNTIDLIYVNVHVSFLYLIDIGYEHYFIQLSSDSPRATFWLLFGFPCRFIYGSEERHILIQIISFLLNSWTRRRKVNKSEFDQERTDWYQSWVPKTFPSFEDKLYLNKEVSFYSYLLRIFISLNNEWMLNLIEQILGNCGDRDNHILYSVNMVNYDWFPDTKSTPEMT